MAYLFSPAVGSRFSNSERKSWKVSPRIGVLHGGSCGWTLQSHRNNLGCQSRRRRLSKCKQIWWVVSKRYIFDKPLNPEALKNLTPEQFELAAVEEKERRHDVMAHVHTFGQVAPAAAGIIHLGATSCYVTEYVWIYQQFSYMLTWYSLQQCRSDILARWSRISYTLFGCPYMASLCLCCSIQRSAHSRVYPFSTCATDDCG